MNGKAVGVIKGHLQELTDTQLLSLINEGNQLAFNQIYFRYWKRLYAYGFNILNDKGLTQDALHEVFTVIWTKREQLEIGNLKNYLFNAVRNNAISTLRKERFTELHHGILQNLKGSSEAEQNFDLNDLKSTINIAVQDLPKICRTIFYLSRFHDYSVSEIATQLNISKRTVENNLSIALKHLRGSLTTLPFLFLDFFQQL